MAILQNTTVSGSLVITGDLTARQFILSSSVSYFTESFASGSTRFGDDLNDTMVVTGSLKVTGSIALGTANPTSLMEINKATNGGSGATFPRLNIINSLTTQGDGSSTYNFADVHLSSGNGAVDMYLATTYAAGTWAPAGIINVGTNHPLVIKVNNTEAMRISGSGNVGIGTTTPFSLSPIHTYKAASSNYLSIQTDVGGFDAALRFTDGASTVYAGMMTGSTNISGGFTIWIGGNARLNVTSGGNIGIGTTNPSEKFHVHLGNVVIAYANNVARQIQFMGGSGLYENARIECINNASYNDSGILKFYTAKTSSGGLTLAMTIDTNQYVGIGTGSPGSRLHIYDGSNPISLKIQRSTVPTYLTDMYTGGTTAGSSWSTNKENTSAGSLTWGASSNVSYATANIILNVDTSTSYITFYTAASANTDPTERMRIFGSGNIRFSSQVYGNTVATPRTVYIQSDGEIGGISSIRASKTNINQLDSSWLMQLNPVSFNYRKKDEDGNYTDEYDNELFYGLIAEETELVNKEICTYNGDKLVGIEYSKLTSVLVKAVQELKAENDSLKEILTRNNIA